MGNEEGQWGCARGCTQLRNHKIPERFVLEAQLTPAMGKDTLHRHLSSESRALALVPSQPGVNVWVMC